MKGTEKQIAWAEKIVSSFKARVSTQIGKIESRMSRTGDTEKSKKLINLEYCLDLDFSDLDASNIIDGRDWLQCRTVILGQILISVFRKKPSEVDKILESVGV